MPEARDVLAEPTPLGHERTRPIGRADLLDERRDVVAHAPVEAPAEDGEGGADARVEVAAGRGRDPRGERRRVELVVRAHDETPVDRALGVAPLAPTEGVEHAARHRRRGQRPIASRPVLDAGKRT
jgi:hypothetical protein